MTSMENEKSNLPASVMIFGCGYVGTALAQALMAEGVRVGALTRNAKRASELREMRVSEVIEAELDGHAWKTQLQGCYDSVVNCVSSAGGGLDGYRKSYVDGQARILEWAEGQSIRSLVYTSSTSVYPQDGGEAVDETADTSAAPATGQLLLESERRIAAAAEYLKKWYVLRLAGIYGPGRHYLLDQLLGGAGAIPGRGDYHMNMIHLDDSVAAILAALAGQAPSGVYNICDDAPATKATVLGYLAGRLGQPAPKFDPKAVSSRLQRRGGRMPDRRVLNGKAKAGFEWRLKYPSYREGYAALLP